MRKALAAWLFVSLPLTLLVIYMGLRHMADLWGFSGAALGSGAVFTAMLGIASLFDMRQEHRRR